MLIDTHAHVNFKAFAEDADATIKRALDEGIWVVNVGTQLDTSRQAVQLAENFEIRNSKQILNQKSESGVYAVIGLHPVHTYSQHVDEEETSFQTREEKFDYEAYGALAKHPKVVGIGECGLDYFRLKIEDLRYKIEEAKELQKETFISQIKLAKESSKALVIHCRPTVRTMDAYEDILEILDKELLTPALNSSPIGGGKGERVRFEIHSFTGSPEIAQEFVKRDAYVGLNGIITFDKTGNMRKVVETVPLERIVLETDAPYLTPAPYRGKRNEPSFVKYVAEKVAEIKNESIINVEKQTTQNARSLFKI